MKIERGKPSRWGKHMWKGLRKELRTTVQLEREKQQALVPEAESGGREHGTRWGFSLRTLKAGSYAELNDILSKCKQIKKETSFKSICSIFKSNDASRVTMNILFLKSVEVWLWNTKQGLCPFADSDDQLLFFPHHSCWIQAAFKYHPDSSRAYHFLPFSVIFLFTTVWSSESKTWLCYRPA